MHKKGNVIQMEPPFAIPPVTADVTRALKTYFNSIIF